jgi:hypothetical protein
MSEDTFIENEIIDWKEVARLSNGGQLGITPGRGTKPTRILMSKRKGAPYVDSEVEGMGIIIYEGEDVGGDTQSKEKNQELTRGNKYLFDAALDYIKGERKAEPLRIFEKISTNAWVDLGTYTLVGASKIHSDTRYVYRFIFSSGGEETELKEGTPRDRRISTETKKAVYERDKGECKECSSKTNLHFDHDVPFSKGGGNQLENIQLLCANCNLSKSDKFGVPTQTNIKTINQ